jgi:hypothetical protein
VSSRSGTRIMKNAQAHLKNDVSGSQSAISALPFDITGVLLSRMLSARENADSSLPVGRTFRIGVGFVMLADATLGFPLTEFALASPRAEYCTGSQSTESELPLGFL